MYLYHVSSEVGWQGFGRPFIQDEKSGEHGWTPETSTGVDLNSGGEGITPSVQIACDARARSPIHPKPAIPLMPHPIVVLPLP